MTTFTSKPSPHWKHCAGNKFNYCYRKHEICCNPFPNDNILDRSKLREFSDDNFRFVENDTELSKQEENTVGKGEIAHYEQFLIFPLCFKKTHKNMGLFGKGLIHYQTIKC